MLFVLSILESASQRLSPLTDLVLFACSYNPKMPFFNVILRNPPSLLRMYVYPTSVDCCYHLESLIRGLFFCSLSGECNAHEADVAGCCVFLFNAKKNEAVRYVVNIL